MAAEKDLIPIVSLTISEPLFTELHDHLFPGDGLEHGAVLLCGVHKTDKSVRLLARELVLARDGIDFVKGDKGAYKLLASFIEPLIGRCDEERLVYLAIHNHGGYDAVQFSSIDIESHENGYPALLDIAGGMPVGALVFANRAAAGDIWLTQDMRAPLSHATIVGARRMKLYDKPVGQVGLITSVARFDRQVRLFGSAGQAILAKSHVAIIGSGGVGSLLVEMLSRLGVGELTVIDPDRIEISNLPRLAGARNIDAGIKMPSILQKIGFPEYLLRPELKVNYARRIAKRANKEILFHPVALDFLTESAAQAVLDVDYIFLAADTHQARLLFNAIVHQYLIPGCQIGSKVQSDDATGEILDVFAVHRPLTITEGCLWCNQLINRERLASESLSENEQARQRYLDEGGEPSPSVIALNGVGASIAVNRFITYMTGLASESMNSDWFIYHALDGEPEKITPRRDPSCIECGKTKKSRYARGDNWDLPTKIIS